MPATTSSADAQRRACFAPVAVDACTTAFLPLRPDAVSDADLISQVRAGDLDAYGTLWQRHKAAARHIAVRLTNGRDHDDLVSEAFLRVLSALQAGRGPDDSFRPYLSIVMRNLNSEDYRRYGDTAYLGSTAEIEPYTDAEPCAHADDDRPNRQMAVEALKNLDDEDFDLLWRTIVQEEPATKVAATLGVTDAALRVRTARARERLRQAFLDQHVLDADAGDCASVRRFMAAMVRDAVGAPRRKRVVAHLRRCQPCAAAMQEMVQANATMSAPRAGARAASSQPAAAPATA